MDMQKMGSFLKQMRTEHNLTQEQLGEKIGISNKTISRWETGTYMPPVQSLELLSNLYEVSINEIVSGERLSVEDFKESAEENLKFALNVKAKEIKKFEKIMLLIMVITAVLSILAISLIKIENIRDVLVIFLIVAIAFVANTLNLALSAVGFVVKDSKK